MFSPLIASLTKSFGIMVDRIVLTKRRMAISQFVPLLFLFLAVFTFFALPFDSYISPQVLSTGPLLYFALMIVLAISWNILYYRAIKHEPVQEFEPILMLSPLVTVLLTPIFFPQERNLFIFLISLVTGSILVFSHLDKGHIRFSNNSIGLIFCIFLMSFEVLVIKKLLVFYSPITLYFYRCLILFLLYYLIYRPVLSKMPSNHFKGVVLTSFLGAIQMIARFYGYRDVGVIFTTLVMSLSPILVYLFCFYYLKEEIKLKKLIGGALILICVIIGYVVAF